MPSPKPKKALQVELYSPHAAQLAMHQSQARFRVCAFGRRAGKANTLDSLILTPVGWTQMRHITIGDQIIGSNGLPTKVVDIHPQGLRDIYKVSFSDGAFCECTEEHLWAIQKRSQREKTYKNKTWQVLTLQEISQNYVTERIGPNGEIWKRYEYTIPTVKPVEFSERSITVDPYVLGVLLGDGCFRNVSPELSSNDIEIVEEVKKALGESQIVKKSHPTNYSWVIRSNPPQTPNHLRRQLLDLGLWGLRSEDKHIPDHYLFNTVKVRLAVLQGLLDTDGSVGKDRGSSFRFTSVSPKLIEGVKFLIRSLGGVVHEAPPRIREDRGNFPEITLLGQLPNNLVPFRLTRKVSRISQREKKTWNLYRAITAIEYIGKKEAQCITVKNEDGLYVTNDFIVTHNSLAASNECVKIALETPKMRCAWVAPSYKQTAIGADLIFEALKSINAICGTKKTAGQYTQIDITNGSKIYFYSAANPDNIRGNSFHFVVVDEFAFISRNVWDAVLRPCLSDTQGRALLISTPFGRGLFYEMFKRGQDPEQKAEYESFHHPTSSNPFIPEKDIEQAHDTLPELVFQQEYLAEFLESGAGVFRNIKDNCKGNLKLIDRGYEGRYYVFGVDWAKKHDFTVVIGMDRDTRQVVYFDRFNQMSWAIQLDRVCHAARKFNGAKMVVDSTGIGDPLYEQIRERGFKVLGYSLNSLPAKNKLIENLAAYMDQNLVTYPQMPEMMNELEIYQYNLSDKTGKIMYSAPEGHFDDIVIAFALATWGCHGKKAFEQFREQQPVQAQTTLDGRQIVDWGVQPVTDEMYREHQNKWRWSGALKSPTYY